MAQIWIDGPRQKSLLLHPLRPELIGWLMGRNSGNLLLQFRLPVRSDSFALVVALAGVLLTLTVASVTGALISPDPNASATVLVLRQQHDVESVTWGLLEDPVGMLSIAVAFATPFFGARQVRLISRFIERNAANSRSRLRRVSEEDAAELERAARAANHWFDLIGRWFSSVLVALVALVLAEILYKRMVKGGLLASWNYSEPDRERWQHLVFDGWWANNIRNEFLAVLLFAGGAYMFYFVLKQVLMGVGFALYAHRALRAKLCVVPDLATNVDGYWGLLHFRSFMFWTYLSTLAHFVISLGVLAIWVEFGAWTTPTILLIMLINGTVVIFPTLVGFTSVRQEKRAYVEELAQLVDDSSKRAEVIDRVWGIPDIPFRLRSTLSALTLYFLFPLSLLLISAIFTSG
jgi:hypothetical protein